MYSGGFGSFVQFKNNNYTYTVFDAVGRWGKSCFTPHERAETCLQEVEGIAVQNNGKEVANIPCRKDANFVGGELGSSFWDKVGLKDLKDDDIQPEFEIPQAFFSQLTHLIRNDFGKLRSDWEGVLPHRRMFPSYRSLPHLECSRCLNLPSARVADHNAAGEARTQWAERSTLYLRNATADAIQDLPDAGGPKNQTAGPDGGPLGQLVRELARQAAAAPDFWTTG
jgi:hypothetical protein